MKNAKIAKSNGVEKWDFFSDFQTLWVSLSHYDKGLLHLLLHLKKVKG